MSTPPYQTLDIARSQWTPSQDNTTLWQRKALAGENGWVLKPREARQLFLGGNILLAQATGFDQVTVAARRAWKELRFQHPEIVVTARCTDKGKRLVEYMIPGGEDEAEQWAERTLITEVSSEELSFSELRSRISLRQYDVTDPASLYLQAKSDLKDRVLRVNFLFNVDHLCTDGIGIRILANCFFCLLTQHLVSGDNVREESFNWQESARNLPPLWTSLMNQAQRTSGVDYETAVARQHKFLLCDTVRPSSHFVATIISHPHPDFP
jgi:hypothetical protein